MPGNGVIIKIDGDDSGFKSKMSGVGNVAKSAVKGFATLTAAATAAGTAIAAVGVKYNAQIEQLQTSFEVMTGSAEKAASVVERLRVMGAETPFEMTDLAQTTQLLMQYGFTADDAIEKMTMLGDISQGNAEAMTSIAMGYAQMSSAGKVNLQDIKQMINGGFNPLQEISERTGESMESLYKRISKGKMSVDEITESMKYATSEGGKFYQSMEKQSKTLNGQLSTLKDNASQLIGSITSDLSQTLADTYLPMVNNMVAELQSAFDKGGFQGLIDSATAMIPDLLTMMTGKLEDAIGGMAKWLPQGVSKLMSVVPVALKSATSVIPKITTSLFDVASTVLTDLVAMLPELVPTLAKGILDTAASAIEGVVGLIPALFDGIEQAMHHGQTKIATVWVDNEGIEKISKGFEVDVTADVSGPTAEDVTTKVNAAKQVITDALDGIEGIDAETIANAIIAGDTSGLVAKMLEGLDVDPKAAETIAGKIEKAQQIITGAISDLQLPAEALAGLETLIDEGASSETIAAYLQSYGVDEDTAKETAQTISTASTDVATAISELPEPVQTAVEGLTLTDERAILEAALLALGLDQTVIDPVLASYSEVSGLLTSGVATIFDDIESTLTDGLPDTAEDMAGLEEKVRNWADSAYEKINEWYDSEVEELKASGKTGEEYDSALLELDEKADALRTSVQETETTAIEYLDTMGGKSTEYVQAHLDELAEISEQAGILSAEIDALGGELSTKGENAFAAVRAGAKVDEVTIGLALNFKATEWKLDTQAAEDAYTAAIDQLNADLASGKIDKEEYDTGVSTAQADLEAAKAAVLAAYENALAEIFSGLAESEGNEEALANAAAAQNAKALIDAFVTNMFTDTGELDTDALAGVSAAVAGVLGDAFNPDMIQSYIMTDDLVGLRDYMLRQLKDQIDAATYDDLSAAIGGKVGEALAAASGEGFLAGTSFDTESSEQQLAAIFNAIATGAQETSTPKFSETGAALGEASATSMDASDTAYTSGRNTAAGGVSGLYSKYQAMYNAGAALGKAVTRGYDDHMEIKSPSRRMRKAGQYTGEGLVLGLQDSIREAKAVAENIGGSLITSASLNGSMRVSMPTLSQEIVQANAQTKTPVMLDGKQIAEIQGQNNLSNLAWLRTRNAKGYGYR